MTKDGSDGSRKRKKFAKLAGNNWVITIIGGLALAILTPIVTGFVDLTFSRKSWNTFGVSNEAAAAGAYLHPETVYKLPLGERFRVEGDLLLSVSRGRYDKAPTGTLTSPNGKSTTHKISATSSMYRTEPCATVAIHLMRTPDHEDAEFFVLYSAILSEKEECKGFWGKIFD